MIGHMDLLQAKELTSSEVKNTSMKVLVSPKEGWDGYVLRVLEVEKEGYTPKHQHPWPHINYIIQGDGELMIAGKVEKVTAGSYAYIPGNTLHQFKNVGEDVFKFICIVPEEGHR